MTKLKTYYIPVELTTKNTLVIEAESQSEAIIKVNDTIQSNQGAKKVYDKYNILAQEITCKEDAEMLEEMVKDLNLESIAINNIVIYIGTECPWCHKTMKYLDSKNLLYTEKNVNENEDYKKRNVRFN